MLGVNFTNTPLVQFPVAIDDCVFAFAIAIYLFVICITDVTLSLYGHGIGGNPLIVSL